MDKEFVLAEIRRTAEASGGTPLGRARFEAATGIRESDWSGRYWARWNDVLAEAGFPPNEMQGRYDEDVLLARLVSEVRRLGRLPTGAELSLQRVRTAPSQPKGLRPVRPKGDVGKQGRGVMSRSLRLRRCDGDRYSACR